jgi:hypothetical protein
MESILGRGYSINEEADLIDQYSPLSSTIDEDIEQDDDLFYPGEETAGGEQDASSNLPTSSAALSSSSIDEISGMGFGKFPSRHTRCFRKRDWSVPKGAFKPPAFKMMSVESTPPPTPLNARRLLDPISSAAAAFQSMTMNASLPMTPPRSADMNVTNWSLTNSAGEARSTNGLFTRMTDTLPKPTATTSLLTPTSVDRYLTGHRRLSDSGFTSSSSSSASQYLLLNEHQSFLTTILFRSLGSTSGHAVPWYNDDYPTPFRFRSAYRSDQR